MKKYNHQEWLENQKKQKREFEEFKIDFAKRYKIAFAQGKINCTSMTSNRVGIATNWKMSTFVKSNASQIVRTLTDADEGR